MKAHRVVIHPGSPRQNEFVESFNSTFRYELLLIEMLHSLREAKMMSEDYRQHHSKHRPRDARTTRPLFAARTYLLYRSSGDVARKTHSNSRRTQTPGLPGNPKNPDPRDGG